MIYEYSVIHQTPRTVVKVFLFQRYSISITRIQVLIQMGHTIVIPARVIQDDILATFQATYCPPLPPPLHYPHLTNPHRVEGGFPLIKMKSPFLPIFIISFFLEGTRGERLSAQ